MDIKPANILLNDLGSLKIGDFGLSTAWPVVSVILLLAIRAIWIRTTINQLSCFPPVRLITSQQSKGYSEEGDRRYMAPELLQDQFDKPADVFR